MCWVGHSQPTSLSPSLSCFPACPFTLTASVCVTNWIQLGFPGWACIGTYWPEQRQLNSEYSPEEVDIYSLQQPLTSANGFSMRGRPSWARPPSALKCWWAQSGADHTQRAMVIPCPEDILLLHRFPPLVLRSFSRVVCDVAWALQWTAWLLYLGPRDLPSPVFPRWVVLDFCINCHPQHRGFLW